MSGSQNVAIFWDFENCHPASTTSGYEVVDNIRRVAHGFGTVNSLKAYLELSELTSPKSMTLRSELQSSGVSLIDCPHNGRKDVADKMILVDMLAYAIDNPAPATIVLISGDRDFAYAVSVLRLRQYRVVVIVPPDVHISLTHQASILLNWNFGVLAKSGADLLASPTTELVGGDMSPSSSQRSDLSCQQNTCLLPFRPTPHTLTPTLRSNTQSDCEAWAEILDPNIPTDMRFEADTQAELSAVGSVEKDKTPSESSGLSIYDAAQTGACRAEEQLKMPKFVPGSWNSFSKDQRRSPDHDLLASALDPHVDRNAVNETLSSSSTPYFGSTVSSPTDPFGTPAMPGRNSLPDPTPFDHRPVTSEAFTCRSPQVNDRLSVPGHYIQPTANELESSVLPPLSPTRSNDSIDSFVTVASEQRRIAEDLPDSLFMNTPTGVTKSLSETAPLTLPVSRSIEGPSHTVLSALPLSTITLVPVPAVRKSSQCTPSTSASFLFTGPPSMPVGPSADAIREHTSKFRPPVKENNMGNARPASILPSHFQPLVDRLQDQRSSGITRPLRGTVAEFLVKQNKALYAQAGCQTFRQYAALAEAAGIVQIGGVDGRDWISLNPAWFAHRSPIHPAATHSGRPSSRLPSTSVPLHFMPLIDRLNTLRSVGNTKPARSIVGDGFAAASRQLYQKAGVSSLTEYISLAQQAGIVTSGGTGNTAWVSLSRSY